MDKISLAGLIIGLSAIVLGQVLEGGHIASLLQPTAFFIVIGGTLGAVMLQSPLPVFVEGARMARWIFIPPMVDDRRLIQQLTHWAQIARRDGLLALEGLLATLKEEPFFRRGLQLLVDGMEPARLREVLEIELDAWERRQRLAARIWESAGGYAPTIGILGAVIGLIHVMENLSDPAKLGAGIAVAFVATIYGVGSANLIFLPAAKKLLAHISRLASHRQIYIDGLVAIAEGENPRIIENKLQGYLA